MKLILAAIIGGLVIFLGGGVLYGIIYMKLYGGTEPILWRIGVACFFQALFMAIIYPHGYKGGSPIGEGFKFGLWIGFLMSIPYFFFRWSEPGLAAKPILVDALFGGILTLLAGIVIGLVYGRKTAAATSP